MPACVRTAGRTFDGNYVAQITASMRARSPHMALSSVVYQTFHNFPDLALMVRGEDSLACSMFELLNPLARCIF